MSGKNIAKYASHAVSRLNTTTTRVARGRASAGTSMTTGNDSPSASRIARVGSPATFNLARPPDLAASPYLAAALPDCYGNRAVLESMLPARALELVRHKDRIQEK